MRRRERLNAAADRWQLALFIGLHAVIFSWGFHRIIQIRFAPSGLFLDYASRVARGEWPYRDFLVEYPPGALLFFLVPRLVASHWPAYMRAFEVEVFLVDVIALILLYRIGRRIHGTTWRILSLYTVAALAMGPSVEEHFDLFPAVIALAAVYCFWLGRDRWSWALLGAGTLTKVFPLLLAPLFVISYVKNRQYGRVWIGAVSFSAASFAMLSPFLIVSPASLWRVYHYHAHRGIQLESTYGAILLLGEKMNLWYAGVYFAFGSWNVAGHASLALARVSTYALAGLLVAAYWRCFRASREGGRDVAQLSTQTALVLLAGLIGSKVLSPQYLIWLIPFLPLALNAPRGVTWVAFAIAGALSYYIFPLHYERLLAFDFKLEILLFARNLLLAALALIVAKALPPSTRAPAGLITHEAH